MGVVDVKFNKSGNSTIKYHFLNNLNEVFLIN